MPSDRWPIKIEDAALENIIIEKLIAARLDKHMSKSTLARLLGQSTATISYWEAGFAFPDRFSKLIAWGRAVGRKVTITVE